MKPAALFAVAHLLLAAMILLLYAALSAHSAQAKVRHGSPPPCRCGERRIERHSGDLLLCVVNARHPSDNGLHRASLLDGRGYVEGQAGSGSDYLTARGQCPSGPPGQARRPRFIPPRSRAVCGVQQETNAAGLVSETRDCRVSLPPGTGERRTVRARSGLLVELPRVFPLD